MLIAITLFNLSIVSFGTYALWTSTDLLTNNNSISTGQIKMSYTESNEIGMKNALPIKDEKGKISVDYFDFQVLTYIKTKANNDTQRKINYNIVLEPIAVDSSLSDNEIKVYLTMVENGNETVVVEPTTIEKLNRYILKSQEEVFSNDKAEVLTNYRLRAWVDESVDVNKLNEKSYSYKFRVNINNEAASPKILTAIEFAQANVGQKGLEQITHETDDTLQVDSKFKIEYRYRGGNSIVKNYVTFNNEIWRIIGIIPTEDISGNVENRFKIIKEESVGTMKWNTSKDTVTDSYNNWTAATLNTYLNNDYYNTLTTDAKNMIGTTKYYLGGYDYVADITSDVMWQYERKNEANRTGHYYGTNPIMQNDLSKKIALMYASDYGYAASKTCTVSLVYYDNSNCKTVNNWLDKSQYEWLLPQLSIDGHFTLDVFDVGGVSSAVTHDFDGAVRPVLTLLSNVKILSGSGTNSDPYELSVK